MGNSSRKLSTNANTSGIWQLEKDRRSPFEGVYPESNYSFARTQENSDICILAGTKYDPCQDNAVLFTPTEGLTLTVAGVFDGHGHKGDKVSQRVVAETLLAFNKSNNQVIRELETDAEQQINRFSTRLQKIFDKNKKYFQSGSTATLAFILDEKVHFGWVGDSMAVLFTISQGKVSNRVITKPHDLSTEEEKKYIMARGGVVKQDGATLRMSKKRLSKTTIGPALAMSRSVGDAAVKPYGCRSDFEYTSLDIERHEGEEQFLVVASDGLWNVFELEQVGELLEQERNSENVSKALAIAAREEWIKLINDSDDVSVIVTKL